MVYNKSYLKKKRGGGERLNYEIGCFCGK